MPAFIDGLSDDEARRIEAEFRAMPDEERIQLLESPSSSDIGPERRYLMVLGLENDSPRVRQAAGAYLNWAGNAKDLLPYLLKFARLEKDEMTRARLAFMLCNYAGDPEAAEVLVEILQADGDEVAEWIYLHMETWFEIAYWGMQAPEVYRAAIQRQPLPKELRAKLEGAPPGVEHPGGGRGGPPGAGRGRGL